LSLCNKKLLMLIQLVFVHLKNFDSTQLLNRLTWRRYRFILGANSICCTLDAVGFWTYWSHTWWSILWRYSSRTLCTYLSGWIASSAVRNCTICTTRPTGVHSVASRAGLAGGGVPAIVTVSWARCTRGRSFQIVAFVAKLTGIPVSALQAVCRTLWTCLGGGVNKIASCCCITFTTTSVFTIQTVFGTRTACGNSTIVRPKQSRIVAQVTKRWIWTFQTSVEKRTWNARDTRLSWETVKRLIASGANCIAVSIFWTWLAVIKWMANGVCWWRVYKCYGVKNKQTSYGVKPRHAHLFSLFPDLTFSYRYPSVH